MDYALTLLGKYHKLSPAFIDDLCKRIRIIEPKLGNTLLLPGDICRDIYLIEKGMLACYDHYRHEKYCSWVMTAGDFVTAVDSFNNQVISTESIVALKKSRLLALDRQDFVYLTETYYEFLVIRLALTEKYHIQSRIMEVKRKHPPEEFYDYLCKNYPVIVNEAPKAVLASLMGITRSTLYKTIQNYRK